MIVRGGERKLYNKLYNSFGSSGFTIVELLIVVVVIAILAAITIVSYTGITQQARTSSLESALASARKQLELDKVNAADGLYPSSLSLTSSGGASYSYSRDATANFYCVVATLDGDSIYTTSYDPEFREGDCVTVDGILAWWPMNGSADDVSGNGNDATPSGATLATGQNGTSQAAYSFDGSNDYLGMSQIGTLGVASDFSISGWVNLAVAPSGWRHIIAGGGDSWGFGISSTLQPRLTKVSYSDAALATQSITLNHWAHVAMSYSSGSVVSYYVNGQPAGSSTYTIPSPFAANAKNIGNTRGGYAAYFNGRIDDLRVYGRVLTAQEMNDIYNAGAL